MFPSSPSYSDPQERSDGSSTPRPLPEVADLPSGEEADRLSDEAAFAVFMKRNLRPQAPPPELLGDIRARIAKIRAES